MDAIVYHSKCGHTYAYAKALASELNIPVYSLREGKKKLPKGSAIIFMSWVRENRIMKYEKALRYHLVCVVAVGILPPTEERIGAMIYENQLYSRLFYLPGGIRKSRLGLRNRMLLKMIESNLSFKLLDSGLKKEETLALDAILHNLDYVNLKELEPILSLYKTNADEYVS
ncbi:MAG: flavodoxin domain-containing protein [Anaeroplasmataceae bacterium]|nr:flavodoxin domain-containing protein [Anaeroplasmataceae bacterium]